MPSRGSLEAVTGPMFSGKTDALIDRFEEARQSGRSVVALKPIRDDRHPPELIVSHSGRAVGAMPAGSAGALAQLASGGAVVLIDEIQFFDRQLAEVVEQLRGHGSDVVAVGLDFDFRAEPFETTSRLLESASHVVRLSATCGRCGKAATLTQRFVNGMPAPLDGPQLVVGDRDLYEPRCARCWHEERGYPAPDAVRPLS